MEPTATSGASAERHVRDMLRVGIRAGVYCGALPLEFDLVKSLGISRNAVRAALQHLVTEGVVSRVRGSGTYVVAHRRSSDVKDMRGYQESQPDGQARSSYRLLEARETVASAPIAAALEIEFGEPVVLLERVALLDGEPVGLLTTWLTAELARGILELDLYGDYYELLEDGLGLELGEARVIIDAVHAAGGAAELLDTDDGAPLLYSETITTLADGRPVSLVCARTRPDRMVVSATRVRLPPAVAIGPDTVSA